MSKPTELSQADKDRLARFTKQDLADLAIFAGGLFQAPFPEEIPHWLFRTGEAGIVLMIPCADWDPLDPAHGDLVLQMLFKKIGVYYELFMRIVRRMETYDESFWEAVCNVAKELIDQEGGNDE